MSAEPARAKRARRGHGRWCIDNGAQKPRVKCLCGELFDGLLAWTRHAIGEETSAR